MSTWEYEEIAFSPKPMNTTATEDLHLRSSENVSGHSRSEEAVGLIETNPSRSPAD